MNHATSFGSRKATDWVSARLRYSPNARHLRAQFLPDAVQQFGEGRIIGAFLRSRAKPVHIPHGREVIFDNADKLVWHDAPKSPCPDERFSLMAEPMSSLPQCSPSLCRA